MGQVAPAGQPLSAARTWANVNMSESLREKFGYPNFRVPKPSVISNLLVC